MFVLVVSCLNGMAVGIGAGIAADVVITIGPIRSGSSKATFSRLEDGRGGNTARGVDGSGIRDRSSVSGIWLAGKGYVVDMASVRDRSTIGEGIVNGGRVRCSARGEYC